MSKGERKESIMSIIKQPNSGFATRLKQLRVEKGFNQQELAMDFSSFLGRKTDYALTTISAWELGRKNPPIATLYKLADYFDVSVDYLCGLSSSRKGQSDGVRFDEKSSDERDEILKESILLLSKEELKKYDGLPIFVSFKKMEYKSQWGLLNYSSQTIKFLTFDIPLGKYDIVISAYPLPNEMYFNFWKLHAYSLPQMLQANKFWIEIYSNDDEIKGLYNGWYGHNENRTAIINLNNGLVLPYTGLNVSYVAYSSPSVNQ